jgi:hypothetical protein
MSNIERAIGRLNDAMYLREINYAGEQVALPVVNLNECRAEIVALMRADNEFPRQGSRDEAFAALAALAAKIMDVGK